MICAIASRSTARKAASPSSRNMSGILRPVISSTKRSVSTKVSRSRRATLRPSVVLPLQLKPTRMRLSIGRLERAEVGQRLLEAVATKFEPHRVCDNKRNHGFSYHSGRGQHAHVAALDVRDVTLTRRVVDRGQRID